jgi:cytidylate kinase
MSLPSTIAIDGPAASGKSTLAARLAEELNYLYLDTGAMYRALTLAAHIRGINVNDEAAISSLAGEVHIDLRPASVEDGRQYDVILDGEDVTWPEFTGETATVRFRGIATGSNTAVTVMSESIARVGEGSVPVRSCSHRANCQPGSGAVLSVTIEPSSNW